MKKNLRMVLLLVVALAMVFTSVACGSGSSSSTSSSAQSNVQTSQASSSAPEAPKEVVTLKLLEVNNLAGTDSNDDVSKAIEEKLSIKLEYIASDKEKFKLMTASNDLGDLVCVNSEFQKQLIVGNQIIAMDDLLQSNGKDILANAAGKVAYSKQYMSDGQNKVFYLPAHALSNIDDAAKLPFFEPSVGWFIRWDYYKELGYPAVNNNDDLLNVLAEIQKKHPKTADGKKTYGIALNTEWNNWPLLTGQGIMNNVYQVNASPVTFFDNTGKLAPASYDDSSFMWQTLKFYNKANRMGLLDPDSFTQKDENVKTKIINGQLFTSFHGWNNTEINNSLAKSAGPEAGIALLPTAQKAIFENAVSPIGWAGSFSTAITLNCKTPDRAMDFLNYLCSYEGARLIYSGVKDVHWTMVDGKPELKPETLQQNTTDPDFKKKTGIDRSTLSHIVGLDQSVIDPADGTILDLFKLPKALALQNTPFHKVYSDYFGATHPGDVVLKTGSEGKAVLGLYNTLNADLMPTLSDDLKRTKQQIEDYILKLVPKIVLKAKTDAEVDSMIKTAQEDLKKLGAENLFQWESSEYTKAQEAAASFGK